MTMRTLGELAEHLQGTIVGDSAIEIRGVAGIREAQPGDITFLANARYDSYLLETRASAVICSREPRTSPVPLLQVDNPYLAFQRLVRVFRPDRNRPAPGVHPTAVVAPDARLGVEVSIGPHCVIESQAVIGDRTIVTANGYVGAGAMIGADGYLHPSVTIRDECIVGERCVLHPGVVIGSDGFGFAFDDGRYHKVPQVGNVVIGDDVEIGANTTVDRATTDSTRIGDGTKIDNLVQIGHNVVIGRHCIIVAQVGISGSTRLEDYVTIGGQAGVAGHIVVGRRATISARAGVTKSISEEAVVSGFPNMPHSLFKRVVAFLHKLPELFQRTKDLERRVTDIEQEQHRAPDPAQERVR